MRSIFHTLSSTASICRINFFVYIIVWWFWQWPLHVHESSQIFLTLVTFTDLSKCYNSSCVYTEWSFAHKSFTLGKLQMTNKIHLLMYTFHPIYSVYLPNLGFLQVIASVVRDRGLYCSPNLTFFMWNYVSLFNKKILFNK